MLSPPLDTSPEDVRALLLPLRNDFSVAVESPGNAFAVGAIIRVAHSFLAREIFVIGEAPFYAKASMGMEKYETVVTVRDVDAFLAATQGRPRYCFEREHARRSVYAVEVFPKNVVLVFGSERFGLTPGLMNVADDILAIPQYGVNQSFPVAIAAGIAMSEWARRRYHGAGA
jgi:tRNA G18 (ribose-2'-O)-methylase SpoU